MLNIKLNSLLLLCFPLLFNPLWEDLSRAGTFSLCEREVTQGKEATGKVVEAAREVEEALQSSTDATSEAATTEEAEKLGETVSWVVEDNLTAQGRGITGETRGST